MLRKLTIVILGFAICGIATIIVIGGVLAAPHQQKIGAPPVDLSVTSVSIPRRSALPVSGWFIDSDLGRAGILLLHSIRSNRREMIGRARFLYEAGYSVLLIDMQGHGETPGEHITFGHRESRDVHAALKYLQLQLPGQPVGVIGVSLGGAATLLGEEPIQADAVVLEEAVYSSIGRAVGNRLAIRLGALGRYLTPLLLWQIEPRLGILIQSLSPVSAISHLMGPTMIIAGSNDRHTLLDESKELFQEASEPKLLWIVPGADHQNFHDYVPEEYERNVLEFFAKHLRSNAAQPGRTKSCAPFSAALIQLNL